MKKVRIFLSSLALVLAMGVTFATQSGTSDGLLIDGWEYIPATEDDPEQCVRQENLDCNTTSLNMCTFSGNVVGQSSTPANGECGIAFRKD